MHFRLGRFGFADKRSPEMTLCEQEFFDVPTPTGPMRTFLFRPKAHGRYPGIVLFSEIFQVTGPIRRMAAQLAGHGYLVAVPEIFHESEPAGTVLLYDAPGADRGNALKIAKPVSAYDDDARAALGFLRTQPQCTGKLGAFGVCLGGHLAFRTAMNPEVRAAACFYATDIHQRSLGAGKNGHSLDRLAEITGELLLVWGRQDPHVPLAGRQIVHAALEAAEVNFQWLEWNAAHAFLRDEGPRYDPALAQICQAIALDLFHRRLGEGELLA